MSRDAQELLLDSNAYFRLANSIHPLLALAFGDTPSYVLHKVVEIIEYWDYENDLPMPKPRLRQVFREYFGDDCPI